MGHGVTTHHAYSRKKEHISIFQCLRGRLPVSKIYFPHLCHRNGNPKFCARHGANQKEDCISSFLPARWGHGTIFSTMGWEQKRCIQLPPCVFKGQECSSPPFLPLSYCLEHRCGGKPSWPLQMWAWERHPKDSRVTRQKKAGFLDNLVKRGCRTSKELHVPRFKPRSVWSRAWLFHLCLL